MERVKLFKYQLPVDCPNNLIKEKELKEGRYGIFYFRVTQNCPTGVKDFVPQLFLDEFARRKEKLEEENRFPELCQMASISILQSESDAIKLMQKFKKIGKYVYKGVILKAHGLILTTPSSHFPTHCSYFAYMEIDEKSIFNQFNQKI